MLELAGLEAVFQVHDMEDEIAVNEEKKGHHVIGRPHVSNGSSQRCDTCNAQVEVHDGMISITESFTMDSGTSIEDIMGDGDLCLIWLKLFDLLASVQC